MEGARRHPIGAEVMPGGGVSFRVWAPRCQKVQAVIETRTAISDLNSLPVIDLEPEADGYFSGFSPSVADGMLYRFRLDGGFNLYPDPASRFQPLGPHGPSQVVNPATFAWTDQDWRGVSIEGQVIYEMHIGTFTRKGMWDSAQVELAELRDAGITVLEVMPIADFAGQFGWGYDGVNLFAPTRLYGEPDDLRRFIDHAHSLGLAVILDVVYNHFGPDGNYLEMFSTDYLSPCLDTEWGAAMDFQKQPVREFFISNAIYWIEEFHVDGMRMDATQVMRDNSEEHIIAAITQNARTAARPRKIIFVGENEPQQVRLVHSPEQGGCGLDALWNDDFHHSAMTVLAGHNEAYYTDYQGKPQEFISMAKYGYLYQGQWYRWQNQRRGTPGFGVKPASFVIFTQNHDQVANSLRGLRAHQISSPGVYRAMTALTLLLPGTPMLFQGQEFSASSPFLYFADHEPALAPLVLKGRREFLAQFPSLAGEKSQAAQLDPGDRLTFERSRLDLSERETHREAYDMVRDLLRLRRTDPVIGRQQPGALDGAVLSHECFLIRFFGPDGNDRLLIVNFGLDLHLDPAPEPLLAPPLNTEWTLHWSSEELRYGGLGVIASETESNWNLPGRAAVLMRPVPKERVTLHDSVHEKNTVACQK